MPRTSRIRSLSGYYHVITRGIGKQILFENNEDYHTYLSFLKRLSSEESVIICAYCLMDNHVHMLIYDPEDHISGFMKRMNICYAEYFNRKYDRTGHLFQDRYRSESVETARYFQTVFRYILKNPEKAGICSVAQYEWSSFHEYGRKDGLTDSSRMEKMFPSLEEFYIYLGKGDADECLDYDTKKRSDSWALSVIQNEIGAESGTILQSFQKGQRNIALHTLHQKGISISQLERLTGISKRIIQRALQQSE